MSSDGVKARRRTAREGFPGAVKLLLGMAAWALLACAAPAQAVLLERVSVSDIGEPADASQPCMSANGRVVAFQSSNEYLTGERLIGGRHVYAHDRDAYHTELVSVSSTGEAANDTSNAPSISGDGRFVAFVSHASNLVPNDTNNVADIFLRDRLLGTTERVSVSSSGEQSDGQSLIVRISADGRFILFTCFGQNLVPGTTLPGYKAFVRDRILGTTEEVSFDEVGDELEGSTYGAFISGDGRFVTIGQDFSSIVYLRDRLLGTSEIVSLTSTGGLASGRCEAGAVTDDGRYVVFSSGASDVVPGDTNLTWDVFLRDRVAGTTTRISLSATGEQLNEDAWGGNITPDGRFACISTYATNVVPGDTNMSEDIFLYDLIAGTIERVSISETGVQGNGASDSGSVSANGRCVAFNTVANNLLPAAKGSGLLIWDRDAGPKPLADFTSTPRAGLVPLTVQFADLSVHGPTTWEWHFGDGGTSTLQNPTHTYTGVGDFLVWLKVTNQYGENRYARRFFAASTFVDVPLDYWAVRSILACADANVVLGYPGFEYRPEETVNRAQMAAYTARCVAGGDSYITTAPAVASFPDVGTDFWAYKYIEYCLSKAVVTGYDDGLYRPENSVDRGQICVYMARTMAGGEANVPEPDPERNPTFPDVSIDFWAFKYIEYCYTQNVVQGYPDTNYHPEITLTRGQMAVFVSRTFHFAVSDADWNSR